MIRLNQPARLTLEVLIQTNGRGDIMAMRQDERTVSFEVKESEWLGEKGVQHLYSFKNGYGASVIKHKGSYGYSAGKWELAVLKGEELCYDTEITDDVIGHLNDPEVDRYLGMIANL